MNEEAIKILEERKSKLCFVKYEYQKRIDALDNAIKELKGENGAILPEDMKKTKQTEVSRD